MGRSDLVGSANRTVGKLPHVSRTIGSTAPATRARILDAARGLFAERGYAGTSMRDLAEVLGITKAALYYHFPGKADILLALVEPGLVELDAIADRAPTMIPLFSDPSAKRDLAERLDADQRFRVLEQALAATSDVLAVRCALGTAHSG